MLYAGTCDSHEEQTTATIATKIQYFFAFIIQISLSAYSNHPKIQRITAKTAAIITPNSSNCGMSVLILAVPLPLNSVNFASVTVSVKVFGCFCFFHSFLIQCRASLCCLPDCIKYGSQNLMRFFAVILNESFLFEMQEI